MHSRACILALSCAAWVTSAHALGPPAMVHTKDGSVYYGELVEKVTAPGDEHVTILLATGVPKRIAFKEIDPSPIDAILPPPAREETRAPTVTMRTKNGSAYHGELIERVASDRVTLKLETGELKTLDWADLDFDAPPPPRGVRPEAAPVENVTTKNGSIYHGEIVEKVVRDHVTLKLATNEIKTIEWQDIRVEPPLRRMHAPSTREPELEFSADDARAVLERRSESGEFVEACHTPCREPAFGGTYRVTGPGLASTPPFAVGFQDTTIAATMTSRSVKTIGVFTSIASAPVLFAGFVLLIASATAPTYSSGLNQYGYAQFVKNDNSALGAANATVNIFGAVMLLTGLAITSSAVSHARVNRVTF